MKILQLFGMFYQRAILWKQGLCQRTENCRVYKFSGPDYATKNISVKSIIIISFYGRIIGTELPVSSGARKHFQESGTVRYERGMYCFGHIALQPYKGIFESCRLHFISKNVLHVDARKNNRK